MSRLNVLWVFCLIVLGCSASKKISFHQIDAPIEIIQKADSGILFVTINFIEKQGPFVETVESVFNVGVVKREDAFQEGDIKCELVNDGKVVRTLFFENPLKTSFEVYGDEGVLERKEVELDKASKVIRLNYEFEWSEMRVYRILDQKEKSLAQIKLTL